LKEMEDLFLAADDDGSDTLTLGEFENFLEDKAVRARLKMLGLEVHEAWGFFNLLDLESKGSLSVQEFARGCLRLRGQARSVDMATILCENKRMLRTLLTHLESVKSQLPSDWGRRQPVRSVPLRSVQLVPQQVVQQWPQPVPQPVPQLVLQPVTKPGAGLTPALTLVPRSAPEKAPEKTEPTTSLSSSPLSL